MTALRTKFYLDKRNGKFLGVCAGIADWTGIDVTWVRVGMVVGTFAFGWPLLAYFVANWVASPKPYALYDERAEDQKFWQKTRMAPTRSIRDVRSTFRDVDRRLRDIEMHVTTSNSRLAAEIDSLK